MAKTKKKRVVAGKKKSKGKAAAKAKSKAAKAGTRGKKITLHVFDPFGPGFRVFDAAEDEPRLVGGAEGGTWAESAGKMVTLEVFDPFGPGFRVQRKQA